MPEEPKTLARRVITTLRSGSSSASRLYCATTPVTSLKSFAGSLMR